MMHAAVSDIPRTNDIPIMDPLEIESLFEGSPEGDPRLPSLPVSLDVVATDGSSVLSRLGESLADGEALGDVVSSSVGTVTNMTREHNVEMFRAGKY